MTAKEQILEKYPDAVCHYEFYGMVGEWGYEIITQDKILAYLCVTENDAWQNALNELIKQGLCTE